MASRALHVSYASYGHKPQLAAKVGQQLRWMLTGTGMPEAARNEQAINSVEASGSQPCLLLHGHCVQLCEVRASGQDKVLSSSLVLTSGG